MAQGYANKQGVSALAKLYGVSRSTVLAIDKPVDANGAQAD